jgi:hypothetical protein
MSYVNLKKIAALDTDKDARVIPAPIVPNAQEYTIKVTTGKNKKDIMNFDGVGISYFKVNTNQESLNKVVEDYLKGMNFPLASWGVVSTKPVIHKTTTASTKKENKAKDTDEDPEKEEFESFQKHKEDYTHPDNPTLEK